MNEEVQLFEDEFKAPHFMTKIDKSLYCASTRDSYHKKHLILIEKKDGQVVISRVVKELCFTQRVAEDADEMHNKTLMLMKHRRIITKKKKKETENDLTESEGELKRFSQGFGQ